MVIFCVKRIKIILYCFYGGAKMGLILGLDVGIGSLGWSVVDENKHRIVDLGVRIFESGEEGAKKAADRASQKRRQQRAAKRLNRRRKHRKECLKKLLEENGIITANEIDSFFTMSGNNPDVWKYRAEGLNRKLLPIELASILINFANYRGYQDFYEDTVENKEGKLTEAKNAISELWDKAKDEGKYETIGEMIYKDSRFRINGDLVIRNRAIKGSDGKKVTNYKYLINRSDLKEECSLLLNRQKIYGYEQLTPDFIDVCVNIIFHQRDFEDGPRPAKNDSLLALRIASLGQQKYTGFDDLVGLCPFYPNEKRGHKNSLLYDMYVLINDLSQLKFRRDNNIITCPESLVRDIFCAMFDNKGTYSYKELKLLCKKNNIEIEIPPEMSKKQLTTAKYIKFLTNEMYFTEKYRSLFAQESFTEEDSISSRIGYVLAKYATPRRRKEQLERIIDCNDYAELNYFKEVKVYKSNGAANVSFKYMLEAIEAYFEGKNYGVFQAEFNKLHPQKSKYRFLNARGDLCPIRDQDIIRNPVVCRTLNEARKIVNATKKTYKGITTINIEVAKDVGQSFEQREETAKFQRDNQKRNEDMLLKLANKLTSEGYNSELAERYLTKYELWISQDMKCMYSGRDITFQQMMSSTLVQIDHIIPQSIVLDETLNNKVLVFTEENQGKGNSIPYQYISEANLSDYIGRVSNLYRNKKISRIKRDYLLLEELTDEIVSGFVDRNINDTRTISKYIATYLSSAYGNEIKVNVIKGAVTSRFRKKWFDRRGNLYRTKSVYGLDEKARDLHYYHHAIDATIVANLTRPYIEIAQDYEKLERMKIDVKRLNKEGQAATSLKIYNAIANEREKAIAKMKKFYGFSEEYTAKLLDAGYAPSICGNLREEIEVRIPLDIKMDISRYEEEKEEYKKLRILLKQAQSELGSDDEAIDTSISPDLLEDINTIINALYEDVACIKKNGTIVYTDKEIIEKCTQKERNKDFKAFCSKLKAKDLNSYVESIHMLNEEEYKVRVKEYYSDQDFADKVEIPYVSFKIDKKYRGNMIASDNPISLAKTGFNTYKELENDIKSNLKSPYYVRFNRREVEKNNFTIYDARKYYCIEVYLDVEGKYQTRAIRYVDIRKDKKCGKLILLKPLPVGCVHCIYLFKNEYIRVCNKGHLISNGFGAYRSVENINRNNVKMRLFSNSNLAGRDICISLANEVTKIEISLLGHITGVVKCGDRSLFTTVNE